MSQSDTVKLISADGFEFIISREAAYVSNTIKSMLDEQGEVRDLGRAVQFQAVVTLCECSRPPESADVDPTT